jgi:putative addiction module component (TIGR02574 family)
MNKIDETWALLKRLPSEKQEIAAEAILDFAAESDGLQLSAEQVAEVERRLQDRKASTLTIEEFRAGVRKLGS